MSTLTLQSPAKLNLSLRVLHRREDGFHEIDTLMVSIPGLADEISFTAATKTSLTCSDPSLPCDENNLVMKAAMAYAEASRTTKSYAISLVKNIPHAAGLGGGSSNAATTLIALNQLNTKPLTQTKLLALAAEIGSDVPFFMSEGAVRCTGRGEILTPVAKPPSFHIVLLKPDFSCPTPEAYKHWMQAKTTKNLPTAPQTIGDLTLVNDLEQPVFAKHLFLADLKQWLLDRSDVEAALLCGSGSTIFAITSSAEQATNIAKDAKYAIDPHLWTWSGRTY